MKIPSASPSHHKISNNILLTKKEFRTSVRLRLTPKFNYNFLLSDIISTNVYGFVISGVKLYDKKINTVRGALVSHGSI